MDNKWMNFQTASVEFAVELCSWLKSGIGGKKKKKTFLTNAVAHTLSSFLCKGNGTKQYQWDGSEVLLECHKLRWN